ncbi:hypothetical protein C4D60_Mb08t32700 [Musa balbisiana]|uniref:Uncharacterized protein n=1 Tax=Musa balbisiana TaxID=52838 RepID=A0A4S8K899_MUSBA|nr:hypothetical protein C4D60_Mb08t32700 [Musa balbisiana]
MGRLVAFQRRILHFSEGPSVVRSERMGFPCRGVAVGRIRNGFCLRWSCGKGHLVAGISIRHGIVRLVDQEQTRLDRSCTRILSSFELRY